MMRRAEDAEDESEVGAAAREWTVGGLYDTDDVDWYGADGSVSESGSVSPGVHEMHRDGSGLYDEFAPDAWADSHMMRGDSDGRADTYDLLAANSGPLWDTESVGNETSSNFGSSSTDESDVGSWRGDAPLFAVPDVEQAPYGLPRRAGVTAEQVETTSPHEPLCSMLLSHPPDLHTRGTPSQPGVAVNDASEPARKKVAEKRRRKSPGVCPLCSRAAYCDLQDAVHHNLDTATPLDGKGRCKPRTKPRKDNRLGLWYRKYGYAGEPYCKGCSESFKSHLIQQKTRPRCGCVRSAPCIDCIKVLDGFTGMSHIDVFNKFDAEKSTRANASVKNEVRKDTDHFESSSVEPQKKSRKLLGGAGLTMLLISTIVLQLHSAARENHQGPSAEAELARCVDDEDARAAANPYSDPMKPFSKSCRAIAQNGQCDLKFFIDLGVKDFCCDSCTTVEPVWICPAAVTDAVGQDIQLIKDPGTQVPLNQEQGVSTAAMYRFCSAAPTADTIPCSFMSADATSDDMCFACTGVQAQLHGASCQGSEGHRDELIPYGWTCRCDGCIVPRSGQCVNAQVFQQDINEFERVTHSGGAVGDSTTQVDAHVIGPGDQQPGEAEVIEPTSSDSAPQFAQPGSTDPAHNNAVVGPAFTYGGIEPPQGEIKMPGERRTVPAPTQR